MTEAERFQGKPAYLFDGLEVIDDPQPHDAHFNMAVDEALLGALADHALLRIYRWKRPSVSFGYFDQVEPIRSAYPGRDLVRRWTGGGVVEHGQDFTYSLLVPRTHPLTGLRAEESYRLLHEVVALAIAAAAPELATVGKHEASAEIHPISRACFANAVRHDLMLEGRKIAGAAQRRTRFGWLQQGSVQLPGDTVAWCDRLRHALPRALSLKILPRALQPEMTAAANRLVRIKYGTAAWSRKF